MTATSDRLIVIGGGSRYRSLVKAISTFATREVEVKALQEWVAKGAAVQAAAVLRRCSPEQVASEWATADPGAKNLIEPDNKVDVQVLREAYISARGEG